MLRTIILSVAGTVMVFAALAVLFFAGLITDPDLWKTRAGCVVLFLASLGLSVAFFYLAAGGL